MIEPDRRTVVGPFNIDLWRGRLRSEVRVWKDIRPALGGLIGHRKLWWYEDPDSFYDGAVAFVRSGWEDVRS